MVRRHGQWICYFTASGGVHVFFHVFTGIKESVCWTPPPEVNPNKTCEYQALCSRFKDLLTLPGAPPPPPPAVANAPVTDVKACRIFHFLP